VDRYKLSYGSLRILPPIGKQKRYPALTLTVLHAREPDEPADRPCNYPHLSTSDQCLVGLLKVVPLCAELFVGQ
jgi:hypothetical protein